MRSEDKSLNIFTFIGRFPGHGDDATSMGVKRLEINSINSVLFNLFIMCLDFDLLRFPADRQYGELAGAGAFITTANDMASR